MQDVPQFRTPAVIAGELGVPLHRVEYVLASRSEIRPSARAGRYRLYDREAVAQIRVAIGEIDSRRGGTS